MSGFKLSVGGVKRTAGCGQKLAFGFGGAQPKAKVPVEFAADSDSEEDGGDQRANKQQRTETSAAAGTPAPPQVPEVYQSALKLAEFVAKNGRTFETITKERNPGDTPFKFLFDPSCSDYAWYDAKVRELSSGKPGAAPAAAPPPPPLPPDAPGNTPLPPAAAGASGPPHSWDAQPPPPAHVSGSWNGHQPPLPLQPPAGSRWDAQQSALRSVPGSQWDSQQRPPPLPQAGSRWDAQQSAPPQAPSASQWDAQQQQQQQQQQHWRPQQPALPSAQQPAAPQWQPHQPPAPPAAVPPQGGSRWQPPPPQPPPQPQQHQPHSRWDAGSHAPVPPQQSHHQPGAPSHPPPPSGQEQPSQQRPPIASMSAQQQQQQQQQQPQSQQQGLSAPAAEPKAAAAGLSAADAKKAEEDSLAAMEKFTRMAAEREAQRVEKERKVELLNETSFDRRRQLAVFKNDGTRGHHMGDYIPEAELAKFMAKGNDKHSKAAAEAIEQRSRIQSDNVGHKLLSKMGWKEGQGLGASGAGIAAPVSAVGSAAGGTNLGLGAKQQGDVEESDDAFELYRKRMMLGYKHRPNPLGNPRREYTS